MSNLRDHSPIDISKFNGLYDRGDKDNTPLDHFQDCENIRFVGDASFASRYGVDIVQTVGTRLKDVVRIYDYPTVLGNTLIVLTYNVGTGLGKIYHIIDSTTVYGPILTLSGMTDFAFQSFASRGYISPFSKHLPHLAPPSAPALALHTGTGVNVGLHEYAISFTGAGGIETVPSPIASITTSAALADPVNSMTPTDLGLAGGGPWNTLTAGVTYSWEITYALPSGEETLASGAFVNVVADAFTNRKFGGQLTAAPPAGVQYINLYRIVAGVYYREQTAIPASSFPLVASGNYWPIGNFFTDAQIVAQPQKPVANNTARAQVQLSSIIAGVGSVTGRNIYRTAAAGTQLKLLHSIANNTTTTYLDSIADASLGANAPTSNTFTIGSMAIDVGLADEFLYVYAGDGTNARKAAGDALPDAPATTFNGAVGFTDAGDHIFGWVSETDSGYLSAPSALGLFATSALLSVSFTNVPISTDANVVRRHLVASAAITGYNGNLEGYTLYFVPNASINNNSDTTLSDISFFDVDLLDDASHLFDNYSEIPAGAVLTLYNDHLCLFATDIDPSIGLVSAASEPEAVSQVDGLLIVPPNGNPISNAQELRDVLYVFKGSLTTSFTDNGDAPSTWPILLIDNGLGSSVHGIATVLDSGGVSVDYLIVATYQGISLFNGKYVTPELSWKIESFWRDLDRDNFDKIQSVNAPIQKEFYVLLPDASILIGNYANGFDPKNIRWSIWTLDDNLTTIGIYNINDIIFGVKTNGVVDGTSGIYKMTSTLRHDVLYNTGGTTTNTKIPNPFFKLGFIGG